MGLDFEDGSRGEGNEHEDQPGIPFDVLIGGDKTRVSIVLPDMHYQPSGLIVHDAHAARLVIAQIEADGYGLLAGAGAVPCELFSSLAMFSSLANMVRTMFGEVHVPAGRSFSIDFEKKRKSPEPVRCIGLVLGLFFFANDHKYRLFDYFPGTAARPIVVVKSLA